MKSIILFLFLLCCSSFSYASDVRQSQQHDFRVQKITDGLNRPWGLAFLPNGDMLVTERVGQLRLIRNNQLVTEPIVGLPEHLFASGQGGLLDVALHPDFDNNQWVYFSYAGRVEGKANTEVARARLNGLVLEDLEIIFRAKPKTSGNLHYGSRLLFLPDGTLLITLGERYSEMDQAQNPDNHLGTIVRLNDDGTVPDDNPFVGGETGAPEVYSYGHRNGQGIALQPETQRVWAHEHGPRGGDEVNIIEAGHNYGWPAITYGIDYSGDIISEETHAAGMEQPVVYWDPSIAPCGMTFYDGALFPEWQGDLFVGSLVQTHLRRLEIKDKEVINQEVLFDDFGRIRDVRTGPDGYIYFLNDAPNGALYRIEPVKKNELLMNR